MQASSQTLSSHIPMMTSPKKQSNTRSNESQNSQGGSGRNKPRTNQSNDRNRQDKNRENEHHKNRNHRKNNNDVEKNKVVAEPSPAPQPATSAATSGEQKLVANIDPFDLFCAYHLGITPDKTYKQANINQVAARFKVDPATIHTAVKNYRMDSASLLDLDFDMALAQFDIQVAPEGVDRVELAKGVYEEFLEAPKVKRDWKKLLDEDRKENQKVFGDS